jgi:hypothetical protein
VRKRRGIFYIENVEISTFENLRNSASAVFSFEPASAALVGMVEVNSLAKLDVHALASEVKVLSLKKLLSILAFIQIPKMVRFDL